MRLTRQPSRVSVAAYTVTAPQIALGRMPRSAQECRGAILRRRECGCSSCRAPARLDLRSDLRLALLPQSLPLAVAPRSRSAQRRSGGRRVAGMQRMVPGGRSAGQGLGRDRREHHRVGLRSPARAEGSVPTACHLANTMQPALPDVHRTHARARAHTTVTHTRTPKPVRAAAPTHLGCRGAAALGTGGGLGGCGGGCVGEDPYPSAAPARPRCGACG